MYRKELLSIRRLAPTPTIRRMAQADQLKTRLVGWSRQYTEQYYEYELYLRAQTAAYRNGRILHLALFYTMDLKNGITKPRYDVYINKNGEEWETYDNIENCWREAKLDMLPVPGARYGYCGIHGEKRFLAKETRKTVRSYLDVPAGDYRNILDWQKSIRQDQLQARYRKETLPWDMDQDLVPPLPKDWETWVSRTGIPEHFLFYIYTKKKVQNPTGYCSFCAKTVPLKGAPKNNTFTACPVCRNRVQYRAVGREYTLDTDCYNQHLIQRIPGGFVVRMFAGYARYKMPDHLERKLQLSERYRTFFDSSGNIRAAYYYGTYRNTQTRWCKTWDHNWGYGPSGQVYGRTLPSLAKQELARTGIPEMQKSGLLFDPAEWLETLKDEPALELLAKAGLTRLALDRMKAVRRYYVRPEKLPSHGALHQRLGIDAMRLARLRKNNGGERFLKWMEYEKARNTVLPDELIRFFDREGVDPGELDFIRDRMSDVQIWHYLSRQKQENPKERISHLLSVWQDYLRMAKRLLYDVNDEIVYRCRKLIQRHNEAVKLIEELGEEKLRLMEYRQKCPHFDEVCESLKLYELTGEKFLIRRPECMEDIFREGSTLHHCIDKDDKYFLRMERKQSYLVFLRRAEEPDKPFYTLEIEPDGSICQKRTYYNRQEKDLKEAEGFLKKWQKTVAERIGEEELRLARESKQKWQDEILNLRAGNVLIRNGELQGQSLADVLEADLLENEFIGKREVV